MENTLKKIFRFYRVYPIETDDGHKFHYTLVGKIAIINNIQYILEDHDGVIGELFKNNVPFDQQSHDRLFSMTRSPYWLVANESDIASGKHPHLLEEMV